MSPEAQRIAIAEACPTVFQIIDGEVYYRYAIAPAEPVHPLHDLNAMHEAEKVLNNSKDGAAFGRILVRLVLGFDTGKDNITLNYWAATRVARATAAQRAEAFLRTLGKWEESQ